MNSYVLMLMSSDLAEDVIDKVGLPTLYPWIASSGDNDGENHERAIKHFIKHDITVEPEKDSNVISIMAVNPDPAVAQRLTQAIVASFIARQASITRDPHADFVQTQVAYYRDQVQTTQKALADFRIAHNLSSMEDERAALLQQRAALQAGRFASQSRLAEDERKATVLRERDALIPPTLPVLVDDRDPALDAARASLTDLKLKEQQLLLTYREDSTTVQDLRRNIAKTQRVIDGFAGRTPLARTEINPAASELHVDLVRTEADLKAAQAGLEAADRQLQELNTQLDERNRQQAAYQDLVRDYTLADQSYRNYLEGVQESRIDEDLARRGISNVTVFDRPNLPHKAKYPMIPLVLIGGTLLGAILGVIVAFTFEAIDERLNTPAQVTDMLELPLLGSMASIER